MLELKTNVYYGVLEDTTVGHGLNVWFTLCDSKKEAIDLAINTWNRLSRFEKKDREISVVSYTEKDIEEYMIENEVTEEEMVNEFGYCDGYLTNREVFPVNSYNSEDVEELILKTENTLDEVMDGE